MAVTPGEQSRQLDLPELPPLCRFRATDSVPNGPQQVHADLPALNDSAIGPPVNGARFIPELARAG